MRRISHGVAQPGVGIVYVATVKEADRLYGVLREEFNINRYHGKMKSSLRAEVQDAFMAGQYDAIIATNAFGMGVDKPDVRFVAHYHFPGSIEAYYQEAGRAGRDGEPALCTILYRVEDRRVQSFFLGGKDTDVADARAVLRHLEQAGGALSVPDLAGAVKLPRTTLRLILMILKSHDLVRELRGGAWEFASAELGDAVATDLTARASRREHDRARLDAMVRYCQRIECRARMVLEYFGEQVATDWQCGNCDVCDGTVLRSAG